MPDVLGPQEESCMSRRRLITPQIWDDAAVAKMTREERLLFVGMITIADDEGRLVASPAHLLGSIFPHDRDVTQQRILAWREAVCKKNPNAQLYEVAGTEYIALGKWGKWNKPPHATPSKLPKPKSREALVKAS